MKILIELDYEQVIYIKKALEYFFIAQHNLKSESDNILYADIEKKLNEAIEEILSDEIPF